MAKKSKEVVPNDQVDIDLVDKAYEDLSQIFSNHLENAMQDAGKYVIKEFYGDDLELARKKESHRKESLYKLIKRLQNRSADSPSKSWIYQSIGIVIQEHDMEKEEKDSFQTFGKLSLSHKLSLLPIVNMGTKKELITAVIKRNLSVRQLEELKAELQIPSETKVSLLTLLNDPDKLTNSDFSEYTNIAALRKEAPNKLKKMREKTYKKREEFAQKQLEILQESEKLEKYAKSYDQLMRVIDKAIETRKPAKRGRPAKKN